MSTYIYFTAQQRERARQTDLAELLQKQGGNLKRSGTEYEWRDGSGKVTIRGNLWYHQYEQEGGDAIDFVKKFYDKTYPEAVEFLLGERVGNLIVSEPIKKEPKKTFCLPKKNETMRRVFAYLHIRRKIDKEVLGAFIKNKMIYESAEYHNAVFVGYDKEGKARHANQRGTGSRSTFKGNVEGSVPEYSFHWNGESDKIYVFEAPIDMLSFISLNKKAWQRNSYAACCGVSDRVLFQMLRDNPNIKEVYQCLDSDWAGRIAEYRTFKKLQEYKIESKVLIPKGKDWNEELCEKETELEETEGELCRELRL